MPYPSNISTNTILVNIRQKENKVLKHIRNVTYEFSETAQGADFILGKSMIALFLALSYHNHHKDYIFERIRDLGINSSLRVLLVVCDIPNPEKALHDLSKLCVRKEMTLIVAWSLAEAGRYLETFKAYENKSKEMLQGIKSQDYLSQMKECLTSLKSVNKTDVITLMSTFGSLDDIMQAGADELQLCPGFGEQKAERLHKLFRTPFRDNKKMPSRFGNLPKAESDKPS
eukprot:m.247756 g.247756  ORF g.247756 m.247756 type:complete len:229 (+) comp16130_c0_seq9:1414-2100(+)